MYADPKGVKITMWIRLMENVYNRYEGDRQVKHRVTKKHLGPNNKQVKISQIW